MLTGFFFCARRYGIRVTLPELLDLLEAMDKSLVFADVEEFYSLSRLCWVKNESDYDKFDRAFAEYFSGVAEIDITSQIPPEWLECQLQRELSAEEKATLNKAGGLQELLEQFYQRLAEQQKRHAGGSKWIGTGGTSPFGAYGFHPGGIRIGQKESNARQAAKVWDKREFRDLDPDTELNTRSMKLALRQLRRFARTGANTELDLDGTVQSTSKSGWLDLKWQAERHNAVKVLLFFDVGGSMDDYIESCEQLFSAARSEFKHLQFFYFHNCIYESVWTDNSRRHQQTIPLMDVLHKYGSDYRVVFVGDATMGPYEIVYPGGSVEHWNEEAGQVWMERVLQHFPRAVWLNPQPQTRWPYYPSIKLIGQIMEQRMFPLTLQGIKDAMDTVNKRL